jgi:RHH-type proline utilization regulon transcriptional repressor/proline dehydrogenase/delta 1-pyrroline-5-carboxylate dehydrogenase
MLRAEAPERGIAACSEQVRMLLRHAREVGAHLHIDAESLDSREVVQRVVTTVLSEEEFREGPSTGLVIQAYLRDSGDQLAEVIAWAREVRRSVPLTIRLVKGAYWDYEVAIAAQRGWAVPVFEDKADCDRNFEQLTMRLIEAVPSVRPVIASHNLRSIAFAWAYAESAEALPALEFQVLRGLGEDVQEALASLGHRVRTYCPLGDLVEGMAYLVRRLLENSSNNSFLRARDLGHDLDALLEAP